MSDFDWEARLYVLGTEGSMSTSKFVWNQQENRSMLHKMKRHPLDRCPVCNDVDSDEHFFRCLAVMMSEEYETLK